MNVRLHGILPEGLGLHFMHRGKEMDLSPDTPVEVDVAEGETLTLVQDPPLTTKWKVLAALGVVITAPLQAALYFGDTKWDDVMPYRLGAVLRPTKEGSCTVQVTKSNNALHPPKLEITGDGVTLETSTCEPVPQVLHQAFFIHMCRVFGLLLWALVLFGALLYVAVTHQIYGAAAICAVVALALVLVCGYIGMDSRKVLRRDLDRLREISGKRSNT